MAAPASTAPARGAVTCHDPYLSMESIIDTNIALLPRPPHHADTPRAADAPYQSAALRSGDARSDDREGIVAWWADVAGEWETPDEAAVAPPTYDEFLTTFHATGGQTPPWLAPTQSASPRAPPAIPLPRSKRAQATRDSSPQTERDVDTAVAVSTDSLTRDSSQCTSPATSLTSADRGFPSPPTTTQENTTHVTESESSGEGHAETCVDGAETVEDVLPAAVDPPPTDRHKATSAGCRSQRPRPRKDAANAWRSVKVSAAAPAPAAAPPRRAQGAAAASNKFTILRATDDATDTDEVDVDAKAPKAPKAAKHKGAPKAAPKAPQREAPSPTSKGGKGRKSTKDDALLSMLERQAEEHVRQAPAPAAPHPARRARLAVGDAMTVRSVLSVTLSHPVVIPLPTAAVVDVAEAVGRLSAMGPTTLARIAAVQDARRRLRHGMPPTLTVVVLLEFADCISEVEIANEACVQALRVIGERPTTRELKTLLLMAQLCLARTAEKAVDADQMKVQGSRALQLSRELDEDDCLAHATSVVGLSLEIEGDFTHAVVWYSVAYQLVASTSDRLVIDSLIQMGTCYTTTGRFEVAQSIFDETLSIVRDRHHGVVSYLHRVVSTLTSTAAQNGDFDLWAKHSRDELSMAKRLCDPSHVAQAIATSANVKRFMGQLEEAMGDYAQEARLMGQQGQVRRECEALCQAGFCARLREQFARARDWFMRALKCATESGEVYSSARALVGLGDVECNRGNVEESILLQHHALAELTRVLDRVTYFGKVQLCEIFWQALDGLERAHICAGHAWLALRTAARKHLPSTIDLVAPLSRRTPRPVGVASLGRSSSSLWSARGSTINTPTLPRPAVADGVSEAQLRDLLQPAGPFTTIIVYSTYWYESVDLTAYVVARSTDTGGLDVSIVPLRFSPQCLASLTVSDSELYQRLTSRNSLTAPLLPMAYAALSHTIDRDELARTSLDDHLAGVYDAIFAPVVPHIPRSDRPAVAIVGDGIVTAAPFHALRHRETGRYVIQDVDALTVSPSLAHLWAAQQRVAEATKQPSAICPTTHVTAMCGDAMDTLLRSYAQSTIHIGNDGPQSVVPCTALYEARRAACVAGHPTAVPAGGEHVPPLVEMPSMLLKAEERRHGRDPALSAALYCGVHPDGVGAWGALLLNVPHTTDPREDLFGTLYRPSDAQPLAHPHEILHAWDLSKRPLVVSVATPHFPSAAIHETAIPLARTLLTAGANRLVVPTWELPRGVTAEGCVGRLLRGALRPAPGRGIGASLGDAMRDLIAEGHGVAEWACLHLHGTV